MDRSNLDAVLILGWGKGENVRGRDEKQAAAVALLAGGTPRGLTPENRPFLSSYVLMSVRRSKFEYILTLGWKNTEMERLS